MERFRRLMGITPEKYSTVSMLRKKVIDVAVSEVNEKTELQIKYELIKT
ncbi:MAG: replication initiation protein [Bacteroidota bacterium]